MSNDNDIPFRTKNGVNKAGAFLGVLIIIFAFLWIASKLGLIPSIFFDLWPQIILVIIGIFILYKSI